MQEGISLPKSGLMVEGEALLKRTEQKLVASHALKDLFDARVTTRIDGSNIFWSLVLAASTWPAVHFLGGWLGWGVAIVAGFFAFGCALGIRQRRLHLVLHQGEVDYELQDEPGDCQGFLLSLRALLDRR